MTNITIGTIYNTIILFALFSQFFCIFFAFFSAEVQFQIAIFLHFRNAFSGEGQFQIAIILHFWRNLIKSRFHYTTKATPPITVALWLVLGGASAARSDMVGQLSCWSLLHGYLWQF